MTQKVSVKASQVELSKLSAKHFFCDQEEQNLNDWLLKVGGHHQLEIAIVFTVL